MLLEFYPKNFTIQPSQAANNKHHTFPRKINKKEHSFGTIRLASEKKIGNSKKIVPKTHWNLLKSSHFIKMHKINKKPKFKSLYFLSILFPFPTIFSATKLTQTQDNRIKKKNLKLQEPWKENINQINQTRPTPKTHNITKV